MAKTSIVKNSKRIDIFEKAFFTVLILYASLNNCGLTFENPVISYFMIASFLMGAVIIVYRLFNYREYIKTPYLILLFLMLLSIGLSTLANYKYELKTNVVFIIYWCIYLFALYVVSPFKTAEEIKKDFRFLSAVFVATISIEILLSFFVFIIGYSKEIKVNSDFTYYIGFKIGRLWGVFVNLNRGAIAAAISSALLYYHIKTVKRRWFSVLGGIMIFLNILFIALADSRSGAVCLALICCVYAFCVFINKAKDKMFRRKVTAALLAAVILVAGYLAPRLIKTTYNFVLSDIFNIQLEDFAVKRGYDTSDDISNRRFDVWGSGIEIYTDSAKNMVIGTSFNGMVPYAREHLPETYIINNDFGLIGTMDNDFFNLLVSQGIIGVAACGAFAVCVLVLLFKNYSLIPPELRFESVVMISAVFAIAGSSMVTSLVFYYFSQMSILFWSLLGYLALILKKSQKGENIADV